jgi:hypothetical protein
MSVWFCIPSARPVAQANPVLEQWRERGYKVALWRDSLKDAWPIHDHMIVAPYPGYALAVNGLVRSVLALDSDCDWIVTGGDDVMPDPNYTAEEIAVQCSEHFAGTFGVLQSTGDRWGDDPFGRARWPDAPAYIDRVAGSPWIGREFCRRVYRGNGPIWPEFWHMFEDEHLQAVAKKLGCFWQRPDLIHYHQHWMRDCEGDQAQMPEFLKEVSGCEHWKKSAEIFERLKQGGFSEAFDLMPRAIRREVSA